MAATRASTGHDGARGRSRAAEGRRALAATSSSSTTGTLSENHDMDVIS